jgi:hypothetical protein
VVGRAEEDGSQLDNDEGSNDGKSDGADDGAGEAGGTVGLPASFEGPAPEGAGEASAAGPAGPLGMLPAGWLPGPERDPGEEPAVTLPGGGEPNARGGPAGWLPSRIVTETKTA